MPERAQRLFAEAVRDCAEPVFRDLGFTLLTESRRSYLAVSDFFAIRVFLGRFDSYVQFQVGPLAGDQAEPTSLLDLHWVLTAVAPQLPELDRWPRLLLFGGLARGELRREVQSKSQLVARHLGGLLGRDERAWERVKEDAASKFGARKRLEETKDEYIARLRCAAQSAWQDHGYWSVRYLYCEIRRLGASLTPAERLRLWWANRWTFDIEFLA